MSFPVPRTELTFAPVLRVEFCVCVCVEVGGREKRGGGGSKIQVKLIYFKHPSQGNSTNN